MQLRIFILGAILCAGHTFAQGTFAVTGTFIPTELLEQNYGKLPKGFAGFDLNICNVSDARHFVVSSEIYQAVAKSNPNVQPVGRQILLAAILRNQNRSAGSVASMVLNSAATILSILSSAKYGVPTGVVTGAAIGAISAQQLLNNFKPVLSADKLEKFEEQALQPAIVLDAGSCVERTLFVTASNLPDAAKALNIRIN